VKVVIDGNMVDAAIDDTILEAAQNNGIYIPTLCHHEDLKDVGICRICMVEIEGQQTLQPACVTKVRSGMEITTQSPRVLQARQTNLKMLLAHHSDNCLVCDAANLCELRKVAAESAIANSYFIKSRSPSMIDYFHPYIQRDLSKCILCRRCVRACEELVNKAGWTVAHRGHETLIVINEDASFSTEYCRDCTVCADICPLGALINTSRKRSEKQPCIFEGGIR